MFNKSKKNKDLKERNDFIISLIVIAVFIVFVIIIFKSGGTNTITETENTLETTTAENNTLKTSDINTDQILDTEINNKTEPIADSSNNDTQLNTLNTNKPTTPELTNSEDNYSTIKDQTTSKNALKTEDTVIEDNIIDVTTDSIDTNSTELENNIPGAEQIEETKDNSYKAENKRNLDTANETITENNTTYTEGTEVVTEVVETTESISTKALATNQNTSDCVIIVGAFREANNLDKILLKLENNGYTLAQGHLKNGMYYAGVPIDCNGNRNDKKAKIKALNTLFNIESWVYKK